MGKEWKHEEVSVGGCSGAEVHGSNCDRSPPAELTQGNDGDGSGLHPYEAHKQGRTTDQLFNDPCAAQRKLIDSRIKADKLDGKS